MKVLNPGLYSWMEKHFGSVHVANPGVEARWRLVESPGNPWNMDIEFSRGHEHYVTFCPVCDYHKPTMWVSYLFMQRLNLSRTETIRHHVLNLACCYHCHAEDDRDGLMSRPVYNMGAIVENRPSSRLLQLFDDETPQSFFGILQNSRKGSDCRVTPGPQIGEDEVLDTRIPPPPLVPVNTLPEGHHALGYLRGTTAGGRKQPVDVDYLAEVYNVGYCQDWVFYSDPTDIERMAQQRAFDRIVFPFYKNGKMVTWQARVCRPDDSRPRWIFPPGQGSFFFGWDHARQFPGVILVEGAFDAVAAGPNAIGLCGCTVSEQKCREIANTWKHVVIAVDPSEFRKEVQDPNGYKRPGTAYIIQQRLKAAGVERPVLFDYQGRKEDPSDLGPNVFSAMLRSTLDAYQVEARSFKLQMGG